MTLPEAATYLRLSEAEILALVETGEIQGCKIGAGYRIKRQKLDEWLAQRG